ncbi:general stress protein 26 [Tamaricihabitans halophyticus]|uniref:General stress protein 26 n=1 Tax=Tamaricihabitans halophyticus TaxID=1262583 RepID=A0A4R2QIX8_9PSEU|nr:pyridoxamine 5'-phosphate oxidase family protein [Tamaricihabitans halophyticus]TCP49332.1 general stress protein 26 [Tamaricihabitans halophyticus]
MAQDKYATEAPLATVAEAFTEMANRMVYATLATVDGNGRPRSRMVHSLWQWNGEQLTGWVGSMVTPMKRAHLARNPYVSCNFWDGAEVYDTCVAECRAELLLDEESKRAGWELFKNTPEPLGYDPGAVHPDWQDGPSSPAWGVLRLEPWFLRVFPGEFARTGNGRILQWREPAS